MKQKTQHKFIFIDCYATWCVPCKWMDEHVYSNKAVGEKINSEFISYRLQMDKTAKDKDVVKNNYYIAEWLERSYRIAAYPTYLFFDSDGNAIHKAEGSLEAKDFIQLANDARNPEKQYYTQLRDFKPGKLDTAEEKALANTFAYTDKIFAAKLAADFLARTPDYRLGLADNVHLMSFFQSDEKVLIVVNAYLDRHSDQPDPAILIALNKLPRVQDISKRYIDGLAGR